MKFIKRAVKATARAFSHWLNEDGQTPTHEVPFDNNYEWLGANFLKLRKDPLCKKKPVYIWGVLQGAALGKVLGYERISVIEFGVAGGRGLLAMERVAELAEELVNIGIDVYGFDAKNGLPRPEDYRDLPNSFFDGQFSMDREKLEKCLRRAQLKLGLVEETIPNFLASNPAPVGFVSIDLDLYSSTKNALEIFEGGDRLFLPRVLCYLDDIFGYTYSDYNGERLAITEFNECHATMKFSPLYGLRYFVPPQVKESPWTEQLYFLHIHNHPLYNRPDSLRKAMHIDIDGKMDRIHVSSTAGR